MVTNDNVGIFHLQKNYKATLRSFDKLRTGNTSKEAEGSFTTEPVEVSGLALLPRNSGRTVKRSACVVKKMTPNKKLIF